MHFTIEGRPASGEELSGIMDSCKRCGIFALKDMGHKTGIGLEFRGIIGQEVSVRSAGYAIYKKGGYGSFLGKGVWGKEEIIRTIQEIADAGADFIKVINSGIVSTKGSGMITEGCFSPEDLKIIHEEALKRNLELACHANSDTAIRNAVEAGVSSIEHGFFISRETLHMMAESGTAWTPTAFALRTLASIVEPSEKRYIEKVVETHLSSLQYAASIGVRLRAGTDSGSKGVRHVASFIEELRLWEKAGLSLEQILSAACMHEEEIEKGNYMLVRRDFLSTEKIEAVYRGCVRVNP
ncbi:MAG: amidohydrolase family protein [Nitrospirae bacterium]|nr:amidohydrolase family protein [Nitrospirota bacterium]MCL5421292.1 amidohydrolase family protein [Nitrospirota bacterium]